MVHQSDGVGAGRTQNNMALSILIEPGDDKGLDRGDPLDRRSAMAQTSSVVRALFRASAAS
jgi:hypothetical protein